MKNCLIVFAKEPAKGRVKTRLQGFLSKGQCLELYKAFLRDTLDSVRRIKNADLLLAYDSVVKQPGYLKSIGRGFLFYKQKGRDIGSRMNNAFKFVNSLGNAKTVIIGTDSPNLPLGYIRKAFGDLARRDLVLGPAKDGGYYLIGLKKPCSRLFKGVKWSSQTVFGKTLKNASGLNKKTAILPKWYDVDDLSGLRRLSSSLKKDRGAAPWTRRFFKSITDEYFFERFGKIRRKQRGP